MMNDDDLKAFHRALRFLFENFSLPANRKCKAMVESIRSELSRRGIHETIRDLPALEGILQKNPRALKDHHQLVMLRPIEKGNYHALPFLALSYDFSGERPDITASVVWYFWGEDNTTAVGNVEVQPKAASGGALRGNLRAIAFRYESPSGGGHEMYHVQPLKMLHRRTVVQGVPPWFPDNEPSFPLVARDPIELIFCIVVSLYGLTSTTPSDAVDRSILGPRITSLRKRVGNA